MKNQTQNDQESLIRITDVIKRTGLSRTVIYGLVREGKFPRQVKIGRTSLWVESEIGVFIEKAKAKRMAA